MNSKYIYEEHIKVLEEDVVKYDAVSETREVFGNKCKHKDIKYLNGELRCKCGAAWSGPRLDELYKLLTNDIITT